MESQGLRAALEYAEEKAEPHIIEHEDKRYADKKLFEIASKDMLPDTIMCSTLSALVEYLKKNMDELQYNIIVHVQSPTEVAVLSQLSKNRQRELLIRAEAILPTIEFGRMMDRLSFNIQLQTKFEQNDDSAKLLSYVGTAEDHTVKQYGDDGISQSVVVKTGLTKKEETLVPNPVKLKPYRTFTEVDQPESLFVFRMDNSNDIEAALFEADGKAWRNEAMNNIKCYLTDKLKDEIEGGKIIVIA